jgi:hypothetical protein
VTTPKTGPPALGWRAFGRFAVYSVLTLCFLALAVVNVLIDGPWTVVIAYLVCTGVLGMMARKVFPRRVPVAGLGSAVPAPNKRSGNPAVRAQGEATEGDNRPQGR